MGDVEIRGGAEARRVAAAFEKAALKDMRRELRSGLTKATKPLKDKAKRAAREDLPKRHGLNKLVARARMTTRSTGGASPGVKIVASGMDQLELIDEKGVVVHPVYGHRPRIVQAIPEAQGWFTDSMESGAPEVRRELSQAIDKLARSIEAAAGG